MEKTALLFITLGGTFLLGLAAEALGRRTRLPRVTMLLILGFLVGPSCFDVLPPGFEIWFQRAADVALTMVGFLLGERLVHTLRQGDGRMVGIISLTAVILTAAVVLGGLWVCGMNLPSALLLAGIATATAPAATVDVVRQMGIKNRLSETLLAVVAIDDAWGLLGFSLLMAAARMIAGDGGSAWEPVGDGAWEIGGALMIGGGLGVVMAFLTGRLAKGEPTLLEAIGFVLLACGLATAAGVSYILAAMVMGAAVASLAKHHDFPFHEIEHIEVPFMILFFVLAGALLDLPALGQIGWLGVAYLGLRFSGRLAGGWLGGKLARAETPIRQGIGWTLMPQAGVAIGMALLAAQKFPEHGQTVLQIAIGSTVVFELVGPLLTRWALLRWGGEGNSKAVQD